MKNYLTIIAMVAYVAIGNAQPVQQMQFRVLDKEGKAVPSAEVTINGAKASYDTAAKVYSIELSPDQLFEVNMKHPDYTPLHYDTLRKFPTALYMMKKGDSYYYRDEIKVACFNTDKFLLVSVSGQLAGSGKKMGVAEAKKRLTALLDSLGMSIHYSFHEKALSDYKKLPPRTEDVIVMENGQGKAVKRPVKEPVPEAFPDSYKFIVKKKNATTFDQDSSKSWEL